MLRMKGGAKPYPPGSRGSKVTSQQTSSARLSRHGCTEEFGVGAASGTPGSLGGPRGQFFTRAFPPPESPMLFRGVPSLGAGAASGTPGFLVGPPRQFLRAPVCVPV